MKWHGARHDGLRQTLQQRLHLRFCRHTFSDTECHAEAILGMFGAK